MLRKFEHFIAFRYLLTRKKTGFISLISVISILGIAVGVGALIIVLSLMNGFTKELRTRLVGMDGHIWVSYPLDRGMPNYKKVEKTLGGINGVTGVSSFCSFESVAAAQQRGRPVYVIVRGIDETTIDSVSDIRNFISLGSLDISKDEEGIPGVIIGSYLSRSLNNAMVGEYIYIYGRVDMETMFEDMTLPPVKKFRITGIFNSGYYDYDSAVALIDIAEAQRILNMENMASGIVLKLDNMFRVDHYTRENGLIDQALGGTPFFSENWIEKNQILFRWMKLEKWAAFIVLSLIILVAAFNIVSSLIMMVMDKTKEVGILKSMGATNKSIERIFVYQGAFVGISGTIMGSVLGTVFCLIQDKYRILSFPPDIYFISALPMDLQISDVVSITLVALFLCWLSSYYPAKKAAELAPVDAIRSE
ncbi:MAG: ABC transporter permease [Candidatus Latescibacteria bacterium]|nr:ABC transporter permease [Candidatus Latescibacterota bacterium]